MDEQQFKPISGNHSISRVIANVIIPQQVIKPKYIFDKLALDNNLSNFQRKGLTETKAIQIVNDIPNTSKFIDGFIFEEFVDGISNNVFRLKNENNRANLTFENKIYTNWKIFKDKLRIVLDSTSEKMPIFIEAISLTYIDEFVWTSSEKIDLKTVLNIESELLNKDFFNSYNGTLVFLSQSAPRDNVAFEEQKTEIVFHNVMKRIIINHTMAIKFKELIVYDQNSQNMVFENFDLAHRKNKNLLKLILREDVQKLINL